MTKLIFRTLGLYGSFSCCFFFVYSCLLSIVCIPKLKTLQPRRKKEKKIPSGKVVYYYSRCFFFFFSSGKSFLQNKCWKVATSTLKFTYFMYISGKENYVNESVSWDYPRQHIATRLPTPVRRPTVGVRNRGARRKTEKRIAGICKICPGVNFKLSHSYKSRFASSR